VRGVTDRSQEEHSSSQVLEQRPEGEGSIGVRELLTKEIPYEDKTAHTVIR
jgi:hypothetical protein